MKALLGGHLVLGVQPPRLNTLAFRLVKALFFLNKTLGHQGKCIDIYIRFGQVKAIEGRQLVLSVELPIVYILVPRDLFLKQ